MEYLTNINNDSHSQSIAKFQETQLSINPNIQDKVIEQVLLQSGGVSLGVILSIVGAIGVAKWMGIGSLFAKWMERVDSGTESLKALADALTRITGDLKDNHLKYLEDHKDILDELSEVKEIIKLEVMPLIKDIERKINK
jgi:hypothetical protein